ncbi:unnamed protein product [Effrenium voratum]|uniref:Uncharacterized protein n=1 Tax=Effrenium voratum TaxID=2562239 RepID=A0AA36IDL5_9DINO|nr:unnamed protein product [Effrenium voratum]
MGCCKSSPSLQAAKLQKECDSLRSQLAAFARSKPLTEDNLALNSILEHLWPHISSSTTKTLAQEMEPSIRLALSKLPSPFNKCCLDQRRSSLGSRAARLLAPRAAWCSPESFSVTARLEWDSDCAFYLTLTGASLGITNLLIVGDVVVELLICPGDSLYKLLSGIRIFFPSMPDIRFDIDRAQLAVAANLGMLKRMLLKAISEKLAQRLVFPNCQGMKFGVSGGVGEDLLEVKKPAVLGLLKLAALQFHGLEPGRYIIETVFGFDVNTTPYQHRLGHEPSPDLCCRHLMVRSPSHQQILVKILREGAAAREQLCFVNIRLADLVYRSKDGRWTTGLETDDPAFRDRYSITLAMRWWPCCNPLMQQDQPPALVSVGICSALVQEDGRFWVVARVDGSESPQRTGEKSAIALEQDASERQKSILQKYKVSESDMAKILDCYKVEWFETLEFPVKRAPGSLVLELWQKVPGKPDKKLGAVALDAGEGTHRSAKLSAADESSEIFLKFRVQQVRFESSPAAEVHLDTGAPVLETEDPAWASVSNAMTTAVDSSIAATGALAVVMDEGIAAVGGAYTGLSAVAQAGLEGFTSSFLTAPAATAPTAATPTDAAPAQPVQRCRAPAGPEEDKEGPRQGMSQ